MDEKTRGRGEWATEALGSHNRRVAASPHPRVMFAVQRFLHRMTSSPVILAAVTLALVSLASLLLIAAASRHKKASAEKFDPVGCLASVEKELRPEGTIVVRGELWPARARDGRSVGRGRLNVRVVGASRHLLEVELIDGVNPPNASRELKADPQSVLTRLTHNQKTSTINNTELSWALFRAVSCAFVAHAFPLSYRCQC